MKMKSRNGSALMTGMCAIAVVSLMATMLHVTARHQSKSALIARDMLMARMIAESGINSAYNDVKHNFSLVKGFQKSSILNGGKVGVISKTFEGEKQNRAQLIASAVCGNGRAVVTADLENRPLVSGNDGEDNFFSLPCSILVNGYLFGRGNGDYTVNSIHCNSDMRFIGSTDFYRALDLSSCGTIDLGKKQKGDVGKLTQNAARIPIPQVPVNAFIAIAEKYKQIYASASDLPPNPPGGVAVCTESHGMWNDKNPNTGCYVFLGNFHVSSGLNLSADPNTGYPAIICLGTSVHIAGSGNKSYHQINGAVYAPNASMHITGGTIRGPIVCGQDFDYSGNGNVFESGAVDGFNLPPKEEAAMDRVVITAWN